MPVWAVWRERTLLFSSARFLAEVNAKYATSYGPELVDPATNCSYRMRPSWAFGLRAEDFTGSPTRWTLAESSLSALAALVDQCVRVVARTNDPARDARLRIFDVDDQQLPRLAVICRERLRRQRLSQ